MKVREIMTSPALTLDSSTASNAAAARMFEHRVITMPVVVERGCLVGVVAEADLYRVVAPAHGASLGGAASFDALNPPGICCGAPAACPLSNAAKWWE